MKHAPFTNLTRAAVERAGETMNITKNMKRARRRAAPACSATDLLLAAILLGRFSPLAPHHAEAIRERLHELNDNELREMVATGMWPNTKADFCERSTAE